jgi:hypothetical protein
MHNLNDAQTRDATTMAPLSPEVPGLAVAQRRSRSARSVGSSAGTRLRRSRWFILAAAGLIGVFAACSSSKGNAHERPTTVATTAVTVAAAATAAPAATTVLDSPTSTVPVTVASPSSGGCTPGGAGSAATATVAAARCLVAPDCFTAVSAYKYDLTFKIDAKQSGTATPDAGSDFASLLGNTHATGQFQAPDRTEAKFQFLGQTEETITIGTDTWTKQGNGPWQTGDDAGTVTASLTPSDLCQQALSGLSATGVKPTSEKLDGQKVQKYEFDHDTLARFQDIFGMLGGGSDSSIPADAKLDVWVTEKEHLPLKMTLQGSESTDQGSYSIDVELTVTDLNGKDITIQPPR